MKKTCTIIAMFVGLLCSYAQGTTTTTNVKDQLNVKFKAEAKPDVYIDGVKVDYSVLALLNADKIASMDVVKGEKAKSAYNAPNGVILIKSKKNELSKDDNLTTFKNSSEKGNKNPLIIIDGEIETTEIMNALDPTTIESIHVLKDEAAIKKYNAPNGAIIITTKK
ncbi:hypothetical protein MWU59_11685 [Flavobacteriaceae bacterium F08102]|nr:hypothetical protein [Flavobacteriaceae bacterium F08102]